MTSNWTSEASEILNCQDRKSAYFIIHGIFFTITLLSSVFGNSLIISCLYKFKRLRMRNVNFLIGSLAFSNLLIAGLIPFELVRVAYPETAKKLIICLVYYGLVLMLMGSAGGNFIIISIERFVAVMFPFRHRTLVTRFRLKLMIASVWILSTVCAFLPLLGWNNLSQLPITTELSYCTVDDIFPPTMQKVLLSFISFDVLVNLILFVPVLCVACGKANSKIHKLHDRGTRSLTKRMAYSFATFSVSWCPFWVSTMVVLFYDGPLHICLHKWSIHIGMLHSAVDWLFYGLGNKSFRKTFKHLFLRRRYDLQTT